MSIEKGYYDFAEFLSKHFPYKVQKISINAGFTCPNRDGSKGKGGCTYCNNQTFNPDYCKPIMSVAEQLEQGKQFFARKYPQMKYLAYFQAYTNTYGELERLKSLYEEALAVEDVVGLVIGTRPDCMPEDLLEYLEELSKKVFVLVEYGAETSKNETLEVINRGHSWEDIVDTVIRTKKHNLLCGLHLIIGLPGENVEDILSTADEVSRLPIDTVKLHQLQLIKGTRMANEYAQHPEDFHLFELDEYVDMVVDYIQHLRPDLVLERFVSQSPADLRIAPHWGLKNHEFNALVQKKMKTLGVFQGKRYFCQ